MASPQSSVPSPVSPGRPRRRFTLDDANRTLPLVRRIAADIVRVHESATRLQQQLDSVNDAQTQHHLQGQLDIETGRLQSYVDELTEIGCTLKDFQTGLVDFFGRHQGRDICLCWKLGEEQIGYWHELDSGFAGRKPVSLLREE